MLHICVIVDEINNIVLLVFWQVKIFFIFVTAKYKQYAVVCKLIMNIIKNFEVRYEK